MSNKAELQGPSDTLTDGDLKKALKGQRSKLLSEPKWNDALQAFVKHVSGSEDGLPRYGSLSILCSKTPFFVYDHPALLQTCETAFATETLIAFSKDFFIELLQAEVKAQEEGRKETSVEFLILHELNHIMLGHHGRMKQFPHNIANIAQDVYNNIKLALIFAAKHIDLGPVASSGWGVTKSEFNLFKNDSEEVIAQKLMQIAKEAPKQNQPGQQGEQGAPQESDSPDDDNAQSNDGQNDGQQDDGDNAGNEQGNSSDNDSSDNTEQNKNDSNGQGDKQPGESGDPSKSNAQGDSNNDSHGESTTSEHNQRDVDDMAIKGLEELLREDGATDDHSMTDQKLAGILEENELDHVKDALGLPDSTDSESHERRKAEQLERNRDAISEAASLRSQHEMATGRPAAGGHSDDYCREGVRKTAPPKISWKTRVKNLSHSPGGSMQTAWNDDESDVHNVIMEDNGFDTFIGEAIPVMREKGVAGVLLDTSGSMPESLIGESIGIADEMLTEPNREDGFQKIYLGSADTSSREDFVEVTHENNYLLDRHYIHGGGGTDFVNPIKELVALSEKEDLRLDVIVYLTDMGAYIPSLDELPENTPPVVFVTTETYESGLSNDEKKRIDQLGDLVVISGHEYKETLDSDIDVDIEHIHEKRGMTM